MRSILKIRVLGLAVFTALFLMFSCGKDEPTCTDGVQSGNEIGVDCGGDCVPCPTCTDGIQNGNETGVDCGGACPSPCYGVGLNGKAGGIIFYDKGAFSGGWRYLEAAPDDLKIGAFWDCYNTNTFAREEGLGKGFDNVEKVRQFPCFNMSSNLNVSPVVLQSYNYSFNGFNDWYLPSLDELQQMYNQRSVLKNLSTNKYWTSTEVVNQNVKSINFNTGEVLNISKQSVNISARAIRKF